MDIKIEYLQVEELNEYENNARKHGEEDICKIAQSIERYGFNDPIGVWKDNIIIEGHGRLEAAKLLGMETVPCIKLDHLTDEQRREYAIAHNRTAEFSEWDWSKLEKELSELDFGDFDLEFDIEEPEQEDDEESKYTANVNLPQYEPSDKCPSLEELCDEDKMLDLQCRIDEADIPEEIKHFLRLASQRHLKFNYAKIADYYAHASADVQRLMEQSALVIIDVDDAIKYGYAELTKQLEALRREDVPEID